jgi:hypothetical protein
MNKIVDIMLQYSSEIIDFPSIGEPEEVYLTNACLDAIVDQLIEDEGEFNMVTDALSEKDFASACAKFFRTGKNSGELMDNLVSVGGLIKYYMRKRAENTALFVMDDFWDAYRQSRSVA